MSSDFRELSPTDLNALAFIVSETIGKKIGYSLLALSRNCPMCEHWNADGETCKLNQLRPPANIIAFGCEMFENVMGKAYGTSGKKG